jgi:hypothetical protein
MTAASSSITTPSSTPSAPLRLAGRRVVRKVPTEAPSIGPPSRPDRNLRVEPTSTRSRIASSTVTSTAISLSCCRGPIESKNSTPSPGTALTVHYCNWMFVLPGTAVPQAAYFHSTPGCGVLADYGWNGGAQHCRFRHDGALQRPSRPQDDAHKPGRKSR